jgi:hypothetical protein
MDDLRMVLRHQPNKRRKYLLFTDVARKRPSIPQHLTSAHYQQSALTDVTFDFAIPIQAKLIVIIKGITRSRGT